MKRFKYVAIVPGNMAVGKKVVKKVKANKKIVKSAKKRLIRVRGKKQNKLLSFLIGIFTVLFIAFLIFQYARQNNYKEVLGKQTHSPAGELKQTTEFKNIR